MKLSGHQTYKLLSTHSPACGVPIIPLLVQQLHHSSGVCPQFQGWQCGAYVGAVEEKWCVVYVCYKHVLSTLRTERQAGSWISHGITNTLSISPTLYIWEWHWIEHWVTRSTYTNWSAKHPLGTISIRSNQIQNGERVWNQHLLRMYISLLVLHHLVSKDLPHLDKKEESRHKIPGIPYTVTRL